MLANDRGKQVNLEIERRSCSESCLRVEMNLKIKAC